MKLLIVDQDRRLAESITKRLRQEGFTTYPATNCDDAMRLFRRHKPHLVVLDVDLPRGTGFELVRTIRADHHTPLIMLSKNSGEADRIQGLDLGADDYIAKPCDHGELVARVKAVLRRCTGDSKLDPFERGDLCVDPRRHVATIHGRPLDLSPKEFALLYFLTCNTGQVFSRDILLDRVWGPTACVTTRTVDVHICWLRQKIEADERKPVRLRTVRGVGYKFAE